MKTETKLPTDALHNHLSIGFKEGCPGCAQVRGDLRVSKILYKPLTEPANTG